jgi:hypothetical protein
VGITSPRVRLSLWGAYIGGLLLLPVVGGITLRESLMLLGIFVAGPALVIATTSATRIRGVAWFVAPALYMLAVAASVALAPILYVFLGVPWDATAITLLGLALAVVAVFAGYLWSVFYRFAHKRASDQSLLLSQWWFLLVYWQALLSGGRNLLLGVVTMGLFGMYAGILALLLRRQWIDARQHEPIRMLLLRTFGDRPRSSRLLRDLTRSWRWIGSINLIAGTDLAAETLEPDEFLDFARGRLKNHFVRDLADLDGRMRELDHVPDRDGRFRVNELLCRDDTWRPALQRLVTQADAVLVDLRGFTLRKSGVVYELEQLVDLVPLECVVCVVDQTTDREALQWTLDRAVSSAEPLSRGRGTPQVLCILPVGLGRAKDARRLLDGLLAAASFRHVSAPSGT